MMRSSGQAARELPLFLLVCETISGEAGYQIIKRTLLKELPLNNPGERVAEMGVAVMNCLAKVVAISRLWVRDLEEKVMG